MRSTCSRLVLLLLLVLMVLPSRPLRADDEAGPEVLTDAEASRRRKALRSRSSEWWRRRKRMVQICPQCKGGGQVRWRRGRRRVMVDCPKCDAHKIHVDRDLYRYCFYDARSPAYRLQEGVRERLTAEFVAAREGRPFPVILKQCAVKEVALVDATHGIASVQRNRDSVTRPQQWIYVADPGKRGTWWLYDAGADGPWPEDPAAETAPEPAPDPVPEAEPMPVLPPVAVDPPPVAPEPERPSPPDIVEREEFATSQVLVATWAEERNDMKARLVRIRLALGKVEGHEKTVEDASTFLGDVERWLAEEEPAYERACTDVLERELGVPLADRLKINTLHFKAHRRLALIEDMLVGIIPDIR